jgi:hypothetical protein
MEWGGILIEEEAFWPGSGGDVSGTVRSMLSIECNWDAQLFGISDSILFIQLLIRISFVY